MKKVASNIRILSAVSTAHFCVDFACIFLVTALLPVTNWLFYAVLYNICAFGLQLPLGILADLRQKQLPLAIGGCLLVALSFLLQLFSPLWGCIAAGIGNGLFHIGGGVAVMRAFPKRAAPLGVFVSPGALGVFFGVTCAGYRGGGMIAGISLLIVMAVILFFLRRDEGVKTFHPGVSLKKVSFVGGLGVLLLFLAVVLRSYLGLMFGFSWKVGFWLPLLFIFGVAAGKAFGGFFGDRFGLIPTALASLTLSAVLFLFAESYPLCGILAVCFFNMTMPLTLFAIGEILGDAKGFAFGLTTFALFLGTLPTLLPSLNYVGDLSVMILLPAISAFFIVGGVALGGGGAKS